MALMKTPLLFCLFLVAAAANAVPHVFSPGQNASSQQVNENFSSLEERIKALEAQLAGGGSDGSGGGMGDGGTPTPDPVPAPDPLTGEEPHPYLKGGVLFGVSLPSQQSPGTIPPSHALMDANDIVLKYISEGSLELLGQRFSVIDKDIYDSGITESSQLSQIAALKLESDASGGFGAVSGTPNGWGRTFLFKAAGCEGEGYLDLDSPGDQHGIFPVNGGIEYKRVPIEALGESIETSVTFESIDEEPNPITGISCTDQKQLIPRAGIPISYDAAELLEKIKPPLRVEPL